MADEERRKMVPAPIPAELFELGYTVSRGGQTEHVVYVCRMDGCYVPEKGRELHRRWHEGLARMIRDAGAASLISPAEETGFGDWPTERLRDQVKHLGSIVTISAGQADHALLREELDAMNAELAKREER